MVSFSQSKLKKAPKWYPLKAKTSNIRKKFQGLKTVLPADNPRRLFRLPTLQKIASSTWNPQRKSICGKCSAWSKDGIRAKLLLLTEFSLIFSAFYLFFLCLHETSRFWQTLHNIHLDEYYSPIFGTILNCRPLAQRICYSCCVKIEIRSIVPQHECISIRPFLG